MWAPRHPAIRRVLRLAGWTLGYVVANQVSFWVALVLANREAGDVSAYSYAYVFFQLPYGVLAVSILTALMPDLAERWSTGDRDGYRARLSLGPARRCARHAPRRPPGTPSSPSRSSPCCCAMAPRPM